MTTHRVAVRQNQSILDVDVHVAIGHLETINDLADVDMGYSSVGVCIRVLPNLVRARLGKLVGKDVLHEQPGDLEGVGVNRHASERIGDDLIRSGTVYSVLEHWTETKGLALAHGTIARTMSESVPGEPRDEGRGE